MITFPSVLSGIIASIVIEVLKIFPLLRQSKLRIAITTLVVDLFIAFGYAIFYANVEMTFDIFISVVLFSLVTYKTITKPSSSAIGKMISKE